MVFDNPSAKFGHACCVSEMLRSTSKPNEGARWEQFVILSVNRATEPTAGVLDIYNECYMM